MWGHNGATLCQFLQRHNWRINMRHRIKNNVKLEFDIVPSLFLFVLEFSSRKWGVSRKIAE